MNHTEQSHPEQQADRYITLWNQADDASRLSQLAEVFTPDGSYTDPMMQGSGLDGLNSMIAAALGQFPGLSFSRSSPVEAHHDALRFSWALSTPAGEVMARGTDVVLLRQGLFGQVIGFLDALPGQS